MSDKPIKDQIMLAAARAAVRNVVIAEAAQPRPDGRANLEAILNDQPYLNSALSVHEIKVILANEGGFMPDEAVIWFREARGNMGSLLSLPGHDETMANLDALTIRR